MPQGRKRKWEEHLAPVDVTLDWLDATAEIKQIRRNVVATRKFARLFRNAAEAGEEGLMKRRDLQKRVVRR